MTEEDPPVALEESSPMSSNDKEPNGDPKKPPLCRDDGPPAVDSAAEKEGEASARSVVTQRRLRQANRDRDTIHHLLPGEIKVYPIKMEKFGGFIQLRDEEDVECSSFFPEAYKPLQMQLSYVDLRPVRDAVMSVTSAEEIVRRRITSLG